MTDTMAVHDSLKAAYEDVAYDGRPNPNSHPRRLAAVGRLFGLAPPPVETARVLELGCGDGANLLPMAQALPGARFTGCDLSALLMGHARAMADGLGLDNVELIEGDLRQIAPRLATYDYIIAHGFYSWVPADVREAMFAVMRDHLAPGGLALVTYNLLPGCHVRRITWDAMRLETADTQAPRERLAASRRIAEDLGRAWARTPGAPELLESEMSSLPGRSDAAIYHDSLSGVNHAVYFSQFIAHAGAYGLGFVSEAETGSLSATGLPQRMQDIVSKADPIAREQYLDFARLRRFRQSLLAPAADVRRARLTPEAVAELHFSAATPLVQERVTGAPPSVTGVPVDVLVDRYPASMSFAQYRGALIDRGYDAADAESVILRGCFSGALDLYATPLPVATTVAVRPRVWPVARWQAERSELVTNLRHEGARLDDDAARELAVACDGTRDRAALVRAVGPGRPDATEFVDHILERLALGALLQS